LQCRGSQELWQRFSEVGAEGIGRGVVEVVLRVQSKEDSQKQHPPQYENKEYFGSQYLFLCSSRQNDSHFLDVDIGGVVVEVVLLVDPEGTPTATIKQIVRWVAIFVLTIFAAKHFARTRCGLWWRWRADKWC